MQKVKLDRMGKEPTIVEVPDNCTRVLDLTATLIFKPMYDTITKRYKKPKVIYIKFWEKVDGKWVLHNEPLEELIRIGYLEQKNLQESIKAAKAEGISAKQD